MPVDLSHWGKLFDQPAFTRQLNFFEQAFLMVIAFYFGTKGFEIMQQEQTKRMEAQMEFAKKSKAEADIPATMESPVPEASPAAVPVSPALKAKEADKPPQKATGLAVPVVEMPPKETIKENLNQHYPHVNDLEESLYLQDEQIEAFAKEYVLEVPAVKAVIEIEASGKGFLKNGRPKILFEGHVFWRRLKAYKINPALLAQREPTILYPAWTRLLWPLRN